MRRMSIKEFSEAAHICVDTIRDLEYGNPKRIPKPLTLQRIKEVLQIIPVSQFLTGENPTKMTIEWWQNLFVNEMEEEKLFNKEDKP